MIHAVIGANYGDEGKGVIVDYLSTPDTLVVRHNGGAQAGHTVVTPEGIRHEFHHFGAGTFQGAQTLLSKYFLVNPMVYRTERKELFTLLPELPRVYVSPLAPVTTPFDMLINRAVERQRGDKCHGSCGMGINETVERHGHPRFSLFVMNLRDEGRLRDQLRLIEEDWVPRRCRELGIPELMSDQYNFLIEAFVATSQEFMATTDRMVDQMAIDVAEHVVFEGAQGLRLDECSVDFPHVTRSRTGLTNVVKLLGACHRTEPLDVVYVTRSYVTRHGAGPLPLELGKAHPFGWVGPETNVSNPYQGALRYARLHGPTLQGPIATDLHAAYRETTRQIRPSLAVTCLDQLPQDTDVWCPTAVLTRLQDEVGMPVTLRSFGPSRADVKKVDVVGPPGDLYYLTARKD